LENTNRIFWKKIKLNDLMKIYIGKLKSKVCSVHFTPAFAGREVERLTIVHTILVEIEFSYTYKFQFCFLICNFIHS